MNELLIVKEGADYFRFRDDGFIRCKMNEATVFPLSKVKDARAACLLVQKNNIAASLMKLTIVEEPFV